MRRGMRLHCSSLKTNVSYTRTRADSSILEVHSFVDVISLSWKKLLCTVHVDKATYGYMPKQHDVIRPGAGVEGVLGRR